MISTLLFVINVCLNYLIFLNLSRFEFDRILEVHKMSLKKMQELQKNSDMEYDQILERKFFFF